VTVIREPEPTLSLRDLILGAFGIVGVLTISAVIIGAVVALGLIVWHRRHRPETDHMPSVTASVPLTPPSSPVR
jgi:hypothetical protein